VTVIEWLREMGQSNTSTSEDDFRMQAILRGDAFPNAVVTCGIVYLEGKGTPNAPPVDIHLAAKCMVAILTLVGVK